MTQENTISKRTGLLIALGWLLALALVFTVPLTLNLAMNGTDAVIDITPRDASERKTFPALWPTVTGWVIVTLLSLGFHHVWKQPTRPAKVSSSG